MYFYAEGEGKTVLYLHGWGASSEAFRPVIRLLPFCRNIAVDFDGFGNSPAPPAEGYSVFDYADSLARFMRENNIVKATVVAHSFGCRVGMVLAANYPELVDGLLLFAPAGLRRFSLKRWCKIRFYKLKKRLHRSGLKPCGSADYQASPDCLKSTFVKVVNQDLSAYARKIRCNSLIVAAKADTAVPLRDAKRLHRLIVGSFLAEVEGDHFALFYSPAAFAQIIRLFVEEQCC